MMLCHLLSTHSVPGEEQAGPFPARVAALIIIGVIWINF